MPLHEWPECYHDRMDPVSIRTIRLVRAVALGCLLLGGCKTANTYSTGEPMSNVELRRIVRDPILSSDLTITAARLETRPDGETGPRLAQLTIRNDGGSVRSFEILWAWRNKSGMNVGGTGYAQKYSLQPGEVKDIQGIGPSEAADFRVTVTSAE